MACFSKSWVLSLCVSVQLYVLRVRRRGWFSLLCGSLALFISRPCMFLCYHHLPPPPPTHPHQSHQVLLTRPLFGWSHWAGLLRPAPLFYYSEVARIAAANTLRTVPRILNVVALEW